VFGLNVEGFYYCDSKRCGEFVGNHDGAVEELIGVMRVGGDDDFDTYILGNLPKLFSWIKVPLAFSEFARTFTDPVGVDLKRDVQ